MTTKEARWKAVGEWLLEVSALLAVFPWLDQVINKKPFDWQLFSLSILSVLILGGIGLYLIRGEED
jgi:hypothetical protein